MAAAGQPLQSDDVDRYIGRLYRSWETVPLREFRRWALNALRGLLQIDGALWASGNLASRSFHTVTCVGLDERYPERLVASRDFNPLLPALLRNIGTAYTLSAVCPDEELHHSAMYLNLLREFGIERICSVVRHDRRTSIHSLFSWYRFDRARDFDARDCRMLERFSWHLNNAASSSALAHLAIRSGKPPLGAAAICDAHGMFYEADAEFLDLLASEFPDWSGPGLPFTLPRGAEIEAHGGLRLRCEPIGDLVCVYLWKCGPLDGLSRREREIVVAVTQGLTFKEVGARLGLAPSTVSNHLYRIYDKLGVRSRAALAGVVRDSTTAPTPALR